MCIKRSIYLLVVLLLCVIEIAHAIGQLFGWLPTGHAHYAYTGAFPNPGPYSGFIAILLPLCLGFYKEWNKRVIRILSLCVGAITISLLLGAQSRAAILAAVVSIIYLLMCYYGSAMFRWMREHKVMSVCIIMGMLTVAFLCYSLKMDSADGRVLIWKNALRAIVASPMVGYGWQHIMGVYGDFQEQYFLQCNFTQNDVWVADAPTYLFNEYLHVAMACGVGILFLFLFANACFIYWGHRHRQYIEVAILLCVLVFAFFSYPFHFVLYHIVYIGALTSILMSALFLHPMTWGIRSISVLMYAFVVWVSIHYIYYRNIQEKVQTAFGQGLLLQRQGDYVHSLQILQEGNSLSSDPMFLVIMAKDEWAMGHYERAERLLRRATHRVPNRIYPYFLLTKLYAEAEYKNIAMMREVADVVLHRQPKVMSPAILQMRVEVQAILKKEQKTREEGTR